MAAMSRALCIIVVLVIPLLGCGLNDPLNCSTLRGDRAWHLTLFPIDSLESSLSRVCENFDSVMSLPDASELVRRLDGLDREWHELLRDYGVVHDTSAMQLPDSTIQWDAFVAAMDAHLSSSGPDAYGQDGSNSRRGALVALGVAMHDSLHRTLRSRLQQLIFASAEDAPGVDSLRLRLNHLRRTWATRTVSWQESMDAIGGTATSVGNGYRRELLWQIRQGIALQSEIQDVLREAASSLPSESTYVLRDALDRSDAGLDALEARLHALETGHGRTAPEDSMRTFFAWVQDEIQRQELSTEVLRRGALQIEEMDAANLDTLVLHQAVDLIGLIQADVRGYAGTYHDGIESGVEYYGIRAAMAMLLLLLAFGAVRASTWLLDTFSERSARRRLFFKRLNPVARLVIWIIMIYIILAHVFELNQTSLLAATAAVGVAVGFAAQTVVRNVFGGVIIIFDQPFQVGDKVRIGDTYGEVQSIGLLSTRVVTSNDNTVSVPNGQVIDSQVSNANSGALECQVVVDLYIPGWSDTSKAKEIAHRAAANSRYAYLGKPIVVNVKDVFKETFLTQVSIKAYVLDTRYEYVFASDVTETTKAAFLARRIVCGDGEGYRVTGTAKRGVMETNNKTPASPSTLKLVPQYRGLVRSTRDNLRMWVEHFNVAVLVPLQACVGAAARRHSELTKANPSLSEYRRAATEQVLQPVAKQLSHLPFAEVLDGGTQVMADLRSAADVAHGGITTMQRRRIFRPQPVEIPNSLLLRYHVETSMAKHIGGVRQHMEQLLTSIVGDLERGLTTWTHGVLELEHNMQTRGDEVGKPNVTSTQQVDAPASYATLVDLATAMQVVLKEVGTYSCSLPANALPPDEQDISEPIIVDSVPIAAVKSTTRQDSTIAGENATNRWLEAVCAGIDLDLRLASLRASLGDAREDLFQTTSSTAIGPLRQALESAATLLNAQPDPANCLDQESLVECAQGMRISALGPLRKNLSGIPGIVAAEHALSHPGERQWATVQDVIATWPDVVELHHMSGGDTKITRRFLRRELTTILAPFPERLADSAQPLRRLLLTIWNTPERIVGIVEFSLTTALAELETGSPNSLTNAQELIQSGLHQATRRIQEILRSLDAPWQDFENSVTQLFHNDWANIQRSMQPGAGLEERAVALRLHILRQVRQVGRRSSVVVNRLLHGGSNLLRLGRSRAGVLIERGRSAIGVAEDAERDKMRTLGALEMGAVQALRECLPLVYARLFTFEPIHETWQLEGRQRDLSYLQKHVASWRSMRSLAALLLPMQSGSGRTSLLGALAAQLEGVVHLIALPARVPSEEGLIQLICDAVGLRASSKQELETALLNGPPRVCLIDDLEHLFLRSEHGTQVVECALSLFSRTDSKVCWIGIISDAAWQYLQRAIETTLARGICSSLRAYQPRCP